MAKLHFNYATMNSGKSIDLIRTAYNYEENNQRIIVAKPIVDTKSNDRISSRIGLERKVDILIKKDDSIISLFKDKLENVKCIFIDEVQFLNRKQIDELFLISKFEDIPVICYGLRTNFKMEAFEGSERLLEISDVLEELVTLCECGKVARYVGRKVDNEYTIEGEEVVIDGTDNVEYKPLCGKCYLQKVKKITYRR